MTFVVTNLEPPDHLWLRVADPSWDDPIDTALAARSGGRWNPPGSWPTLYLCRDLGTARAQVQRLLAGTPVDPDDLTDDAFDLVAVRLHPSRVVDVVTADGVAAAGLPDSYPGDADGRPVAHEVCRPIAVRAHEAGLDGIEARSALVLTSPTATVELAWWPRAREATRIGDRVPFGRWRSPNVASTAPLFTGTR